MDRGVNRAAASGGGSRFNNLRKDESVEMAMEVGYTEIDTVRDMITTQY